MENFYVNEGNLIGGQEPQPHGTEQTKITASTVIVKGELIEITGNFTVGTASNESNTSCGIAQNSAEIDENVVISAEGLVKMDASAVNIDAGDEVVSAGNGKIKTYVSTGKPIGIAVAGCIADGVAYIKLSI